ncbi:DUF2971 domain-containing protein [Thiomicrorhabdus indica]|uniref:DUF2971 domain-containing protein n=1 Tax=Thiomicrorhabdus indica TaxID=2267253 RepID=UPI00102D9C88|nr:DUF2971 domain-containing protein [Thiomicrorhabdus indica]
MTQFVNYLNLKDSELDQYIYRIISLDRLNQLFNEKVNVLVSPELWDDPFENFIMKSNVRFDDGTIANIDFSDDYYGQCWTLHKASDAMWRIYSNDKKSVRIRTTVRKLAESLSSTLGELKNVQSYIGKVEYLPNKGLMAFANTVLTGLPQPTSFAKTLLVKRPAFRHEKEVRLIYMDKDKKIDSKLFSYSIDPHELVDQIMIDPRLTKSEANEVKKQIISSTKFQGTIKRSLLYDLPEGMVFNFR